MSLRTNLLGVANSIRQLRATLDQAPNQLSIIQRTWSGGYRGAGTVTDVVLISFPAKYPIKEISAQDEASSGGLYKIGDIMMTHITPSNGVIGYTPAQLRPTYTTDGIDVIYRITGPLGGDYSLVNALVGGHSSSKGVWSGRGGVYSYGLHLRKRPFDNV